jgi:hypothetical protein
MNPGTDGTFPIVFSCYATNPKPCGSASCDGFLSRSGVRRVDCSNRATNSGELSGHLHVYLYFYILFQGALQECHLPSFRHPIDGLGDRVL